MLATHLNLCIEMFLCIYFLKFQLTKCFKKYVLKYVLLFLEALRMPVSQLQQTVHRPKFTSQTRQESQSERPTAEEEGKFLFFLFSFIHRLTTTYNC